MRPLLLVACLLVACAVCVSALALSVPSCDAPPTDPFTEELSAATQAWFRRLDAGEKYGEEFRRGWAQDQVEIYQRHGKEAPASLRRMAGK